MNGLPLLKECFGEGGCPYEETNTIFANWVNAPEWGVILAVAVMGAFIIGFNDKKK